MSKSIRIAIIGPESTGKTQLCGELSIRLHASVVPELARDFLPSLGRPYEEDDLLTLARLQAAAELNALKSTDGLLICDTSITVIRIWSEFKYGRVHPEIIRLESQHRPDLSLLTDIDIPWQEDPLREHPAQRKEIFSRYYTHAIRSGMRFQVVFGTGETRTNRALRTITDYFQSTQG
jgi:nicotinamide riboside kinase